MEAVRFVGAQGPRRPTMCDWITHRSSLYAGTFLGSPGTQWNETQVYVVPEKQLRRLSAALGFAMVAFSVTPTVAPGAFARLFGFPKPDAPTAAMMRSLGVRDLAMGMGLWSAAVHGGNYAPWLLGRLLTDGGDALAMGIATGVGYRNARFLSLGALSLGAAASDAMLWRLARSARD